MQTLAKQGAWFTGWHEETHSFQAFKSHLTPTRQSHGKRYGFCYGPYRTKKQAVGATQWAHPWVVVIDA